MATKAYGYKLECSLTNGSNYATVGGLTELTQPTAIKETIDTTSHGSSGIRNFIGGIVNFGEVSFTTNFYNSAFQFSQFPSATDYSANYVYEEIDINGVFADTDEGHVGDSGWRADTGGGFSIISGTPNKAHLDLGDDSSDPSYARRFNVFGPTVNDVSDKIAYTLEYEVTEVTGTDPAFRWEYSSGSAVYYNAFSSVVLPHTVGTHKYTAMLDKAPHLNLSMRGSGQTNSITFTNVKLYRLYTWQELMTSNKTLYFRIKDGDGNLRGTFNGFVSGIEHEVPMDDLETLTISAQVNGAVTY